MLQQVVETQPQFITTATAQHELPIEQQVQNLLTQENNVIMQQAPKVSFPCSPRSLPPAAQGQFPLQPKVTSPCSPRSLPPAAQGHFPLQLKVSPPAAQGQSPAAQGQFPLQPNVSPAQLRSCFGTGVRAAS